VPYQRHTLWYLCYHWCQQATGHTSDSADKIAVNNRVVNARSKHRHVALQSWRCDRNSVEFTMVCHCTPCERNAAIFALNEILSTWNSNLFHGSCAIYWGLMFNGGRAWDGWLVAVMWSCEQCLRWGRCCVPLKPGGGILVKQRLSRHHGQLAASRRHVGTVRRTVSPVHAGRVTVVAVVETAESGKSMEGTRRRLLVPGRRRLMLTELMLLLLVVKLTDGWKRWRRAEPLMIVTVRWRFVISLFISLSLGLGVLVCDDVIASPRDVTTVPHQLLHFAATILKPDFHLRTKHRTEQNTTVTGLYRWSRDVSDHACAVGERSKSMTSLAATVSVITVHEHQLFGR